MTLKDLDGKYFLNAVYDFIKTTAQVYPGTNIIALIREKAEQQAERDRADKAFKLTAESDAERMERWKREAAPMPDEARKELDKLGIRITQQ